MMRRLQRNPWLALSAGVCMGLLMGVGVMIGAMIAVPLARTPSIEFPGVLNATATDSTSTMAIATGPIDGEVEGLFVLDFLTGELQCSVLNPRTGTLGGLYKHNVVLDLGVEQGKQPKYLMVTGAANFRVSGGNVRPAASIVYVADANTGRYAAYMLPWDRQAQSYNFAQMNPMILLGTGDARQLQVE